MSKRMIFSLVTMFILGFAQLAWSSSKPWQPSSAMKTSNEIGDRDIAVIVSAADLSGDRSEFYYPGKRQGKIGTQRAPRWVLELEAFGKTGENVLESNSVGYAPVAKGQSDIGKPYVFGVGVALTKKDSSIEIKLLDGKDRVVRSAVLKASAKLFWRAELGEFISGTADFPSRLEVQMLSGRGQADLSLRDTESNERTILPVAPTRRTADTVQEKGGGPYGGGYAYFSNGPYDCCYFYYSYSVYSAPPNTCGTLHVTRNGGADEVTPGWICTDAGGNATKGPWSANINETATNIYIQWDDGTRTAGGDYHVNDISSPELTLYSGIQTGYGAPIPSSFFGNATDALWGTGFNAGYLGWTIVRAAFYDATTRNYYSVSRGCYCAGPTVSGDTWVYGSISPSSGFNVAWSIPSGALPPSNAHSSNDSYEWTVQITDYFYTGYNTFSFDHPQLQ